MSFASTCKYTGCNKFTDDPSNLCPSHQGKTMNDLCPGCKKAPHAGGCKLPDLPPKREPPLVDPNFEAKREASYEGREWKPAEKDISATEFRRDPFGVLPPTEREDDAEAVAKKIDEDFLYIGNLHPAMADLLRECVRVQGTKGRDYTEGSNDRLNNFREASAETGASIEQVWYVYFFKHWKAVRSWIRFGQVESEPIRGRIVDCINYLLLLWLIVREKDPSQD